MCENFNVDHRGEERKEITREREIHLDKLKERLGYDK